MQDLTRQLGIAIRWLPLILVGALLAGGIAYSVTSSQPKVYASTARLAVDPGPNPSAQHWTMAEGAADRYAEQATSGSIAEAVIDRLDLDESARGLKERVTAEVTPETFEVAITARSEDPRTARAIANNVAAELRQRARDVLITDEVRAVSAAIATNQKSIRTLENRLNGLRRKANKTPDDREEIISLTGQISSLQRDIQFYQEDSRAYVRNLLEWTARPQVPTDPIAPRPLYWTLLALVAGGMLAAALAFVLEYLRSANKVLDERDLEAATGQATLGEIHETRRDARRKDADRLVTLHYPRSDEAEAYRGLIARAGFSGGTSRMIMVTSPRSSDAKSLAAANIAVAYAEAGRNVILVDADYRSPRTHSFFGVSNDRGLTSILTDSATPLGWATLPSVHPRLGLMPAGPMPRETAEPLGERQLNALLRRLLQAADLVVFDSPAIGSSLDAAVLAAEVDGAILVVPRESREEEIIEAARALRSSNAEFLGAALYRPVRRSRKGAHAKVPPAPKGWGPTWPMMYEQVPRIPAAARSAPRNDPAAQGTAARPSAAPQPPPVTSPATGPYAVPFAGDPNRAGSSATARPAASPAPAVPTDTVPLNAAPATATPAAGAPTTVRDGDGADVAAGRPQHVSSTPAPAPGSQPDTTRVAIPVRPDEATTVEHRDDTADPRSSAGAAVHPPGPVQARPESMPS